jgi:hypothetical protein
MISHRLDVAIQEAILDHARRHKNGVLEVEAILSAVGEIAATFLAEVPGIALRQRLYDRLAIGIAEAANGKRQGGGMQVITRS